LVAALEAKSQNLAEVEEQLRFLEESELNKDQLSPTQQELEELRENLLRIGAELAALQTDLREKEGEARTSQVYAENAREELENLRAANQSLQFGQQDAETSIQGLRNHIQQLQQERETLRADLDQAEDDYDKLLKSANNTVERRRGGLGRAKRESEDHGDRASKRLRAIKQECVITIKEENSIDLTGDDDENLRASPAQSS